MGGEIHSENFLKRTHLKFIIANSKSEDGMPTWTQIKYNLSLPARPYMNRSYHLHLVSQGNETKMLCFPRCQQETWKHSIDGNWWRKKFCYGAWNTKDRYGRLILCNNYILWRKKFFKKSTSRPEVICVPLPINK